MYAHRLCYHPLSRLRWLWLSSSWSKRVLCSPGYLTIMMLWMHTQASTMACTILVSYCMTESKHRNLFARIPNEFWMNSSGPRETVIEYLTVYPQKVIETSWIVRTQFSHECLIPTLGGSSEEPVHISSSLLHSVTSLSVIKQLQPCHFMPYQCLGLAS